MTELKWQEPPAAWSGHAAKRRIQETVDALKARPGEWALVYEASGQGLTQSLRRYGCEVTLRMNGVGESGQRRWDIYARWPAEST